MPIPPPKRTGAEAVIQAMIQRLQVTRPDIMAFLDYGRMLDLADPPAPPTPQDHGPKPKDPAP